MKKKKTAMIAGAGSTDLQVAAALARAAQVQPIVAGRDILHTGTNALQRAGGPVRFPGNTL